MELNASAIVESITSMSEIFVANSRTPYTEFLHSGGTLNSHSSVIMTGSGNNSTPSSSASSVASSSANLHSLAGQTNLNSNSLVHHHHIHQFPSSSQSSVISSTANMFATNQKGLVASGHFPGPGALSIQQHHSGIASGHVLLNNNNHTQMHSSLINANNVNNSTGNNNSNNNNNENNFSNNQLQHHNTYLTNNHIANNTGNNNNNNTNNNNNNNPNNNDNSNNAISNNNKNDNNSSANASNNQQQNRVSQPLRTQIPIHCYIEQLDACADILGYSSPLNDNDLFNNTTNNKTTTNNNSSATNQLLSHNTHLHQSKLALESVTNGSNSSNNLGHSDNQQQQQQTQFNQDASTSNNHSNGNVSTDYLTTLTSSYYDPSKHPLTINNYLQIAPSNSIQQSSSGISGNNKLSSTSTDRTFQSCRETYAIVTSNVLFIDLVRTVLLQLGYSATDLINAKGKSFHEFLSKCLYFC